MPAVITATLLGSINNAINTAFNTQFWAAPSAFRDFTYVANSEADSEVYPALAMLPGVREWIGPRLVHNLGMSSFTIKNRKFEETIEIARTDIEDDKYGMYSVVAGQMGQDARQLPDKLVAQVMQAGTTTVGYDGQYFFSTGHPSFTSTGAPTTVSNYAAGSSPGWYLLDRSKMLRPFIFQDRVPFSLVTRFNPDDPSVFDNDAFLWGTRGRCNAGFGLWQLAYYSTQPLNMTNLEAAKTAMSLIRRPDGTPMGVTPDTIVVPTSLALRAKSFFRNELIANDPTAPTTLIANEVIGEFKPIEFPWLN